MKKERYLTISAFTIMAYLLVMLSIAACRTSVYRTSAHRREPSCAVCGKAASDTVVSGKATSGTTVNCTAVMNGERKQINPEQKQ